MTLRINESMTLCINDASPDTRTLIAGTQFFNYGYLFKFEAESKRFQQYKEHILNRFVLKLKNPSQWCVPDDQGWGD
jgi:hypothetical protein